MVVQTEPLNLRSQSSLGRAAIERRDRAEREQEAGCVVERLRGSVPGVSGA